MPSSKPSKDQRTTSPLLIDDGLATESRWRDNRTMTTLDYLRLAQKKLQSPADKEFAMYLDSLYPTYRQDFHIPTNADVGATNHPKPLDPCIYFCGNSLGLQPKLTNKLIQRELDVWATRAIQAQAQHDELPWISIHKSCTPSMSKIVGAKVDEVA